jgi:hypothetical protein
VSKNATAFIHPVSTFVRINIFYADLTLLKILFELFDPLTDNWLKEREKAQKEEVT